MVAGIAESPRIDLARDVRRICEGPDGTLDLDLLRPYATHADMVLTQLAVLTRRRRPTHVIAASLNDVDRARRVAMATGLNYIPRPMPRHGESPDDYAGRRLDPSRLPALGLDARVVVVAGEARGVGDVDILDVDGIAARTVGVVAVCGTKEEDAYSPLDIVVPLVDPSLN